MSLAKQDRLDNLDLALRLIMDGLAELYAWQEHEADSPKFAGVHQLLGRSLFDAVSSSRTHMIGTN
jgi:hypothetical protein